MKIKLEKFLPQKERFWRDLLVTLILLFMATGISMIFLEITGNVKSFSEMYILSVLMVALNTNGYFWGFLASVIAVVGSNYFFLYPYFNLDFSLSGYPIIFICMLCVAMITSTLVTNVKDQIYLSKIREQKTHQLYEISQQLLSKSGYDEIASYASDCLIRSSDRKVVFFIRNERGEFIGDISHLDNPMERNAVIFAFDYGEKTGYNTDFYHQCEYDYFPFAVDGKVWSVAGIHVRGLEPLPQDVLEFHSAAISQFSLAIQRQHLDNEWHEMVMEKQKEQMRSNLLRAISHDLRTPLTGIIGAVSVITENPNKLDSKTQNQLFKDIYEDAAWLLRMVENVLSVTRIGSNAPKLRKVLEPMEEVISQAARRCRVRHNDMDLKIELPEELIMVPMDGTLMEQVIINLIENAYQHGEQTPIIVQLEEKDGSAILRIRDHGPGIPVEKIDTIFEEFHSKNAQQNDISRGLGIGLSICKSILMAHGGQITCKNAESGQGAVFMFSLPIKEAPDV